MSYVIWTAFVAMICGFLALDLGVFNKKDHVIGVREAMRWTAIWVTVAMGFVGVVYLLYQNRIAGFGDADGTHDVLQGTEAALLFLTGYLVEYSLSIDNIFVIALLISHFKVPRKYQHRVLFWGILGALVMRGAMIGAGTALIRNFTWTMYLFGAILIFSAVKMAISKEDDDNDPHDSWVARTAKKFYPLSPKFHGHKFFVTLPGGSRAMTPLFLVLLLVESTDVLFAVDSIPAVFAVTTDPFLVFTSNVFAIMGLRSLFFALAGMLGAFHHLKYALVALMAFIGLKMLASHYIHIAPALSLAVIAVILGIGIATSLAFPLSPEEKAAHLRRHGDDDRHDEAEQASAEPPAASNDDEQAAGG